MKDCLGETVTLDMIGNYIDDLETIFNKIYHIAKHRKSENPKYVKHALRKEKELAEEKVLV